MSKSRSQSLRELASGLTKERVSLLDEEKPRIKVYGLKTADGVIHSLSTDNLKTKADARLLNQSFIEFTQSFEETPLLLWLNHKQLTDEGKLK